MTRMEMPARARRASFWAGHVILKKPYVAGAPPGSLLDRGIAKPTETTERRKRRNRQNRRKQRKQQQQRKLLNAEDAEGRRAAEDCGKRESQKQLQSSAALRFLRVLCVKLLLLTFCF